MPCFPSNMFDLRGTLLRRQVQLQSRQHRQGQLTLCVFQLSSDAWRKPAYFTFFIVDNTDMRLQRTCASSHLGILTPTLALLKAQELGPIVRLIFFYLHLKSPA